VKYVKKQITKLNKEMKQIALIKKDEKVKTQSKNDLNLNLKPYSFEFTKRDIHKSNHSLEFVGEKRDENLEALTKNVVSKEINKQKLNFTNFDKDFKY